MNKKLFMALAISFIFMGIGAAQADLLVDTGQPIATTGGMSLNYPRTLFAQFVLNKAATITDIQGWVNVTAVGGMQVQIYQDNGDSPGSLVNGADGNRERHRHLLGGRLLIELVSQCRDLLGRFQGHDGG